MMFTQEMRYLTDLTTSKLMAHTPTVFVRDRFQQLSDKFWQHSGLLQDYMNFLLCEADPLFNQQRLAAQVVRVQSASDQATTFWLKPSSRWTGFTAGQFIRIDYEFEGVRYQRNYSISCSPAEFNRTGLFSITVKTIDAGKVSGALNKHLVALDVIHISQAMGEFTYSESLGLQSKPYLFIAAGSGITPIKSMIDQWANEVMKAPGVTPKSVHLIYCSKHQDDAIFVDQLSRLATRFETLTVNHHQTDTEGYLTKEQMLVDCPQAAESEVFLCGPQGFMKTVRELCADLSIDEAAIHSESFGTSSIDDVSVDHSNAFPVDEPRTAEFVFADKRITTQEQKTLLELAEAAGLAPKYGCRSGVCHECKCKRPQGSLVNQLTQQAIPSDQTHVQACITVPTTNITMTEW